MIIVNDSNNTGNFKVNKGYGTGGLNFSTYDMNGNLTQHNLLSHSNVIIVFYYNR